MSLLFNPKNPAKCKLDCGSHGTCEGSSCTCFKGWTGPRCDQKLCDSRCSSHGSCSNGTCICSPGYYGKHCTLNGCPSNCTGHGQCIRANSFSLMSTSSSSSSSTLSSSSSTSTASEGESSASNYNSNNINGLGDSTLEGWRCICHDGWTGLDCSHPLEANCADDTDNDNGWLFHLLFYCIFFSPHFGPLVSPSSSTPFYCLWSLSTQLVSLSLSLSRPFILSIVFSFSGQWQNVSSHSHRHIFPCILFHPVSSLPFSFHLACHQCKS